MGELRESSALLGFYGDDLDPEEITALMGVEPTVGVKKGDKWLTSRGGEKIAYTGSWRLKAERRHPADLDGQIDTLISLLPNDLSVWRHLSARFRGVVLCGLWLETYNDGVELSAATLSAMGERGLLLDLDIYQNDDG
jgi:hypothetical protein